MSWIAGIIQGAATIAGGEQERKAADEEAAKEHVANKAAANVKQEETDIFYSQQQAGYSASGVDLEGSPLLVMADTLAKGGEDIVSIRRGSREDSLLKEGKARQTQAVGQGASSILGSFGKAFSKK